MKRRAIVIFSDGSKRMAHNTDDLMFRWHERRISTAEDIYPILNDGFYIPDFDNTDSSESLLATRGILVQQKKAIESQILIAKTSERISNQQLAQIKNGALVLDRQLGGINRMLLARNVSPKHGVTRDERLESLVDKLMDENRVLRARIKHMADILQSEFNYQLSEELS